jgi:hypothetical protein
MKFAKKYKKNIYCLEGDWQKDLRKQSSIYASLMFLEKNCDIKHIHKHCGTKESLFYYLNQWKLKKYSSYSICYLAFHGFEGEITIGKDSVTLEEISDILEDSCKDKIIFIGSCLVLQADKSRINDFLKKTGALCVCGYKVSVDFVASSVFEMLVLDLLQQYKDISCVQRDIGIYYAALAKKLEFKIHTL